MNNIDLKSYVLGFMNDLEKIKWFLIELSDADPDDIESNDLEICGEDENGADGCFTEQITKIAEIALLEITDLQEKLKKADKVAEAARLFNLDYYLLLIDDSKLSDKDAAIKPLKVIKEALQDYKEDV